jgi:hypothetical protein
LMVAVHFNPMVVRRSRQNKTAPGERINPSAPLLIVSLTF